MTVARGKGADSSAPAPAVRRRATGHKLVVEYMGLLRQAAGQPQDTFLVPAAASVRDMLALIREKHEGAFCSHVFDDAGELLPNIHLFLNDEDLLEEDWDKPIPRRGQLSMLLMLHPIEGG